MNPLYRDAIIKAGQIRKKLGFDMFQPINIFDICTDLGINVKFVDINMEGLYINHNGNPSILISCLRPLSRRVFTCGHELGHHVFNHGFKADILTDENQYSVTKHSDEILVDSFSAAFLMPVAGVQYEFSRRDWKINSCGPLEFFVISSVFGIGYQTLIIHCRVNKLILEDHFSTLAKWTPAKIFYKFLGEVENKSNFKILDLHFDQKVIDLEVGNYLLLPAGFRIEDGSLEYFFESKYGSVFKTLKSGIFTVQTADEKTSFFLRVQNEKYIGFAEYRHFEN